MAATRPKADKIEHLRLMEQSLLEGMSHNAVVSAASKRFGISTRTCWEDVSLIMQRWHDAGNAIKNQTIAHLWKAILRRELIFAKALATDQLAIALNAERDRCELLQLYAKDASPQAEPTLSPLEIRKRLQEALKEEIARNPGNGTEQQKSSHVGNGVCHAELPAGDVPAPAG